MTASVGSIVPRPVVGRRPAAAGLAAAGALLVAYLAIIGLAQSWDHAVAQLAEDAPYIALVVAGFGIQVALLLELRAVDRGHRAAAAVTAAGTGTSAVAMLACCAHHLVDVLPLVGLSAAAVLLEAYKVPLLLLGIGSNLVGIAILGRRLAAARRRCAALEAGAAAA